MTKLRALNDKGISEFRGFLQQIRDGAEFRASPAILYTDDYSPRVPRAIEIEPRRFANKYAAAEYLSTRLGELAGASDNAGLWSWLALFYFDQLSPVDASGKRRPREDYHYIPSQDTGWHRDRHLLAGPCKLFMTHREHARLLLHPPVHQHGAFIYDLGFRRDLITNRGLIEAIDLLYWDAKRNRPKRGATTANRPGNLRRLIAVVQQLDINYDLYGMRADEILHLLPPEFDGWRPAPLLVRGAHTSAEAHVS
ncbi:MAG TPA: hypothetical protein VMU84_02275 [Thermoanaerobaculia bacterium]|nr:hypothetical protein [Thermoanaerobaculia bacterium]